MTENIKFLFNRIPEKVNINNITGFGEKIHSGTGGSVYFLEPDNKLVIKLDVSKEEWETAVKILKFQEQDKCHKNVVPIYAVGMVNEMYCYIMPYLEAINWDNITVDNNLLIEILLTLLSVEEWLEKNIEKSHIDIKKDNIMIYNNSKMLIDFSLICNPRNHFRPDPKYKIWPDEIITGSSLACYTIAVFILMIVFPRSHKLYGSIKDYGTIFIKHQELKEIIEIMLNCTYNISQIYDIASQKFNDVYELLDLSQWRI